MKKLAIGLFLTGLVHASVAAPSTWVQSVNNGGETITMRLKLQNLRGSNFELWAQNATGAYDVVTPVAERSYMGTVDEYPGAVSCGILKDDGTFWGAVYFDRGATWFTLGSAVTGTRGTTPPNGFNVPAYSVTPGHAGSITYGFDVGIDVNYEYYTIRAGSDIDTAFEMVEYSVALTQALYIRDALLRPYLGRVILRTSQAHDPEQGHTTDGAYLTAMTDEWNTNHADSNFDLVAGIARSLHQYGGLASSGYSVNGSDANGNFSVVWRHEMGHNWGLGHYDGGNPEGATINSGNAYARMSGPEVERALNRRDARMAIIDDEGTYTGIQVPPYAAIDSATLVQTVDTQITIDVLANDHDANGQALSIDSYDSTSAHGGTINLTGQDLVYTPPTSSFIGTDYFTYVVSDVSNHTATGVATIDVQPNDSLRLYLPLDETSGTATADHSAFGNDGTVTEDLSAISVAGKFGNAINLDGVDDRVEVPNVRLNTNTVTLTAWVKQGSTQNGWAGIIFDRTSGGSGLNVGDAGELRYHWNNSQWGWNSGLTPPADTWTFVALVVEPSKATIYMNTGSGFQSAVRNSSHSASAFATTYIGSDPNNSGRHFDGAIDDARIYNYAMSQSQLQDVYAGGGAEGPNPLDGASGVSSRRLKWAPGAAAISNEVYLGTSEAAVASATKVSPEYQGATSESFFKADLEDTTTYFWRIDTVTGSGTLTGTVWSFTTGTVLVGDTILVNFQENTNQDFAGGQLIGPTAVDSSFWNSVLGAAGSDSGLIDSIGDQTDVDIDWDSSTTYWNSDGTSDDEHRLAVGYLDDGSSGSGKGATVTLSNIPYTTYKVYGLFATDQNNGSTATVNFNVNGNWALGGNASTTAAAYGTIESNHAAHGEYWTEIVPGSVQGNYWTVNATGSTCTIVGELKNGTTRGCLTAVIIRELLDTDGDGIPDEDDTDDDGDGMTDVWEIANGLDPLVDDSAENPDFDLYDNGDEYITDTNPQDAASYQTFAVEIVSGDPTVRFGTSAARNYVVEYRDELGAGSWMDLGPAFPGSGSEMTVPDTASATNRYYRLRIEMP